MEVDNVEEVYEEFNKLYVFNQNGVELLVSKVQGVEELPYKLEGKGGDNG
jgi:hypothetical protein